MTKNKDPEQIGETVKRVAKRVKKSKKKGTGASSVKLVDTSVDIKMNRATKEDIAFQHSILCQTTLPLSDPKDARYWDRQQGDTRLIIQTEVVENPKTGKLESIGLPYGSIARLILAYLNTEAKRTNSPKINVGDSMTSFIKSVGFSTDGRSINRFKDQLRRLGASNISMSFNQENRIKTKKGSIIDELDLWFPKDANQRILWDSEIVLNDKYFKSLINHAVPIDQRALASLARSPLAIDIYCWLAQRLYRVNGQQFLTWQAMREQFGGTGSMDNFKKAFRNALNNALLVYPQAKIIEDKNKGFILFESAPPISTNTHFISK